MKIYKYILDPEKKTQTLTLPKRAKLLSIKTIYDRPTLWAVVNEVEQETEEHAFRVLQTGEHISEQEVGSLQFMGTCVTQNGSYEWHIFRTVRIGPKPGHGDKVPEKEPDTSEGKS